MESNVDDDAIAEAQRALLSRRAELGLLDAPRSPVPLRTLAGEVARDRHGAGRCARCGAPVEHPGICAVCGATITGEERFEQIRVAIEREIPSAFALWARWGDGLLERRVLGGADRIRAARTALGSDAPMVVLVGAGRAGKTSLAAAALREALRRGELAARWVSAWDLASDSAPEQGGPLPFTRALHAEPLVLDDLGAELAGAPSGSGLLAQRIDAAARLVAQRYDRGRRRTIITTAIGTAESDTRGLRRAMAAVYGDGTAGRIYERAAVVRLGGAR